MIKLDLQKQLQGAQGSFHLQLHGDLEMGQFVALYGASGAGKTTLLRMLAGLLKPDQGFLEVNGQVWIDTQQGICLPPQKRKVGLVFQDLALFPHLTVKENLQFAQGKKKDPQQVQALLEAVELTQLQGRKPDTLSGGQQQRVALARALASQPDILLLDEPLSALDTAMRAKLQQYLLALHRQFGVTTMLVSHDLPEVYTLAEQVWVMEGGAVVRKGSPQEVFLSRKLSGKFQFVGQLLHKELADVVCLLSVLVGQEVVRLVVTQSEGDALQPGDKLLVASKAFNPVIMKLDH